MRPAYLSCLDCPPSGSLCVRPLSKCLFASSIRGDKEPNKERGRRKQNGFLCSPSFDMPEDLLGGHNEGTDCNENGRRQVTSGEEKRAFLFSPCLLLPSVLFPHHASPNPFARSSTVWSFRQICLKQKFKMLDNFTVFVR